MPQKNHTLAMADTQIHGFEDIQEEANICYGLLKLLRAGEVPLTDDVIGIQTQMCQNPFRRSCKCQTMQKFSRPHEPQEWASNTPLPNASSDVNGQWIFRYKDWMRHMMDAHTDASVPWPLYRRRFDDIPSAPCRWCSAWNVDTHNCLVLLQAVTTLQLGPDSEHPCAPRNAADPEELSEELTALLAPQLAPLPGASSFMEWLSGHP